MVYAEYIEGPSDHDFTAFLARVAGHKAAVVRELSAGFTEPERERATYLAEKQVTEVREEVARVKAAPRFGAVPVPAVAPDRQLELAIAALSKQAGAKSRRKAA